MIESLTPDQEYLLKEFREECLEMGRSIKPIDHATVESIITQIYAYNNEKKPNFHYYDSPHQILSKHPEVKLDNYFGGQHWIYWKAFYTFAEKIGVKYEKEDSELLALWMQESEHLHWWFPYEEDCLISERPIKLNVNEAGQLHCESGPAIEYRDGWKRYYLNGICVPEYLVTTDSEYLDINFFLKESNADIKAEFVRKFGVERMSHLGTKVDSYENYNRNKYEWWHKSEYELWDLKALFPGLDYQPYVKMLNQTTGIWHMEAVSPACRSLADALKERFGGRMLDIISIS
jgi:hypothetical protein